MSIEADIMDAVLILFNDKIYPVQQTLRDYTQPEQIPPDKLPFLQAYVPDTETAVTEDGQQANTLAFVLSLYDVQGTAAAMRPALSALSLALDRDPTLGGLAKRVIVTGYSIAEAGDEEPDHVDATLEALYFPDQIFNGSGQDVDILPLEGLVDDIGHDAADIWQDSTRIPGAVEGQKLGTSSTVLEMEFGDNSYPLAATVENIKLTRFLRISVYISPELDPAIASFFFISVHLQKTVSPNVRIQFNLLELSVGWNQRVMDLDDPDVISGGGFDPSVDTIERIRIRWFFFNSSDVTTDFPCVLGKLFYRPSDLR